MLKATKNNRVYLCSLRGIFYVCVQTLFLDIKLHSFSFVPEIGVI